MLAFSAYYEHHWFDWVLFVLSCAFLLIWIVYWVVHVIGLTRSFFKFGRRSVSVVTVGDEAWPGVSIIKPLVGVEEHLAANLESFFTMDYPLYELLICVQCKNDPCIPLVEKLMDRYSSVPARLFVGGKHLGVNPKINNMAPGYDAAKYDLVVISDSCIRMRADTLMDMVQCMTDRVGLVHQMPFVGDPTSDFVNILEKVFFGTCYTRVAMFADVLGINCTTGMSVLMRRQPLDAAGGLRAFSRYLAEDYFMARAVQQAGYQLTVARQPALQMRHTGRIGSFQARLVRWCKLRVAMVPLVSLLEPFTECLLLGVCAALSASFLLAVDALSVVLVHVLSWLICDWIVLRCVQGGPLPFSKFEFVVAWLVRELMAPVLVARALCDQRIQWHSRTFKLRWGGEAVEVEQLAAPAADGPLLSFAPATAPSGTIGGAPSAPPAPPLEPASPAAAKLAAIATSPPPPPPSTTTAAVPAAAGNCSAGVGVMTVSFPALPGTVSRVSAGRCPRHCLQAAVGSTAGPAPVTEPAGHSPPPAAPAPAATPGASVSVAPLVLRESCGFNCYSVTARLSASLLPATAAVSGP